MCGCARCWLPGPRWPPVCWWGSVPPHLVDDELRQVDPHMPLAGDREGVEGDVEGAAQEPALADPEMARAAVGARYHLLHGADLEAAGAADGVALEGQFAGVVEGVEEVVDVNDRVRHEREVDADGGPLGREVVGADGVGHVGDVVAEGQGVAAGGLAAQVGGHAGFVETTSIPWAIPSRSTLGQGVLA